MKSRSVRSLCCVLGVHGYSESFGASVSRIFWDIYQQTMDATEKYANCSPSFHLYLRGRTPASAHTTSRALALDHVPARTLEMTAHVHQHVRHRLEITPSSSAHDLVREGTECHTPYSGLL
ncbi:hypothetical protein OE88DRAFT_207655 [Heliocybe sulcata]|uniref:Uncharacterized protein n=1 Tax=Heliocybe sulcata TaxID=5364 RepID=A0A5C3N0B6_9AGAM|nr:hypothetical protein OE88DRAFT_207655 [Heliocybe sulcata]